MVILRMFALEKIFTKQELTALDDIVPSFRSVVSAGKRSKEGRWHFTGLIQKKILRARRNVIRNDNDIDGFRFAEFMQQIIDDDKKFCTTE